MITPPESIDTQLISDFVRALQAHTPLKVAEGAGYPLTFEAAGVGSQLDALLRLEGSSPAWLAVQVLNQAYPRDIRNALWILDEYARIQPEQKRPIWPVVLAHHLSPGARQLLRSRNVAFYDASGSFFLQQGPIIVDIERPPAPATRPRPSSLFTGAREQVVHVLLHQRDRAFTGAELAEQARTSTFTVSETLRELDRRDWLATEGRGRSSSRRLAQPSALLDAWADAWKSRREERTRWYLYASNPAQLRAALTDLPSSSDASGWAATGSAAGNLLAPLLTNVDTLDVIVPPGQAQRLASAVGAKSVDKGSNISIVERSGASDLFRVPALDNRGMLASPFVVYLDLLKDARGRNKELAEHLRSTILKL